MSGLSRASGRKPRSRPSARQRRSCDVVVQGPERDEHPRRHDLRLGRALADLGVAQHVLEVADPGLHQRLLVLGGVVLRVLADVAVLPRGLQALCDVRATGRLELAKLVAQARVRLHRERRCRLLPRLSGGAPGELFGQFHETGEPTNWREGVTYASAK